MARGIRQNGRLLGDFLGHEVLVAAFLDGGGVDVDCPDLAIGAVTLGVDDLDARPAEDREIALFQIGDAVGERGERDGVGAKEHLAVAVPDGERRAFSGCNDQVFLAVEEKGQRVGALEPSDGLLGGVAGGEALVEERLAEKRYGFGVCLCLGAVALLCELFTKRLEILDDPVVDDGNGARAVRVRVQFGGRAMGRPTGVADASFSGKRFVNEEVGQVDEFAYGSAPVEPALVHGRDPGAVISPIFQPFQRFDQRGRRLVIPKNSNNTAHYINPSVSRPWRREDGQIACGHNPACCPACHGQRQGRRRGRPC